jgi:hypothetical protein
MISGNSGDHERHRVLSLTLWRARVPFAESSLSSLSGGQVTLTETGDIRFPPWYAVAQKTNKGGNMALELRGARYASSWKPRLSRRLDYWLANVRIGAWLSLIAVAVVGFWFASLLIRP